MQARTIGMMALVTVTVALCAVQSLYLDGVVGLIFPVFFTTDTLYAPGYSDRAWRRIYPGLTPAEVMSELGQPLEESWQYGTDDTVCATLWLRQGNVEHMNRPPSASSCPAQSIHTGDSAIGIRSALGPPARMSWMYSASPTKHSYRERVIQFRRDRVAKVVGQFYID